MRIHIELRGIVQGVGFRPFVYRLAQEFSLNGFVRNTTEGIEMEAQGAEGNIEAFLRAIQDRKPPHSVIHTFTSRSMPEDTMRHESSFEIRESTGTQHEALISPDLATCPDCLADITDPENRRYRYPFTNCTNCGPRYTIITALPYDRPNTTMQAFTMCPACEREYHDPNDRRFHAQPNACPACGPQVELRDAEGTVLATKDEAMQEATSALLHGKILAVKGIGGFHLLADATNAEAVKTLRARKRRAEKPLAVLFPDSTSVQEQCILDAREEAAMRSAAAPIVLIERKKTSVLAHVNPNNPNIGAFLPYSPLHHLLLIQLARPVIATSGNLTDEPICTDENEALERLHGIADLFLIHNRPIARAVDDSVVRVIAGGTSVLRLARGYAPQAIPITRGRARREEAAEGSALAVGAHLKNTIAIGTGSNIILSQHIGDLEHAETAAAFQSTIAGLEGLYHVQPNRIVCDAHPDYTSTRYAEERAETNATSTPMTLLRVQHHVSHAYACMTDNRLDPRENSTLAVTWDGTGYGDDGTIWGGEFFRITPAGAKRVATIRPFRLPGGEAAIRFPKRIAASILHEIGEKYTVLPSHEERIIEEMLTRNVQSPVTTSIGRLFDAVAALLDLCTIVTYEGQAAVTLEHAIEKGTEAAMAASYPFTVEEKEEIRVIDWEPAIRELIKDIKSGTPKGIIAGRFHNTMTQMIVSIAQAIGEKAVCLSGGCFQNKYLTERTIIALREAGFTPYWHHTIPSNDGGIAVGQLAASGWNAGGH